MRSLLKCSRIEPAVGMSLEFKAATIRSIRSASSGPEISAPLTSFGLLNFLMSCIATMHVLRGFRLSCCS